MGPKSLETDEWGSSFATCSVLWMPSPTLKLKTAAGKLSELLQRLGVPQPSAHRLSTPSPPSSEPLRPRPTPKNPRPSSLPDLACFGLEPPPVTNWRQSKGYVRPAAKLNNPPPPTLKMLSHNLEKKPPTPFIFHNLQKGYHVLLLQELNEEPSLPHVFSHRGGKMQNFHQHQQTREKNGTAIVVSSALRPYTKFVPHSDNDGLMCSVEITLPGGPPTLLTSLYSPPPAITRCPLIEINLSRLLFQYPYHVVGGDFNCTRNPHLDSLDTDSNPWAWVTSKTSGSNQSWIDAYRHMHSTALGWTRPASKNRLDYIFVSRSLFHDQKIADASILYGDCSTDHHPVTAQLHSPLIPTQSPPPPRKRFRMLKKQELLRLQGGLQPLEEWCEGFNKHLPYVPTSDLVPIVDAIL